MPTLTDLLPSNRREMAILLAGAAVSFGLHAIPGITIEPAELTECRSALVSLETGADADDRAIRDLETRINRCWEMRRSSRSGPSLEMGAPMSFEDLGVEPE